MLKASVEESQISYKVTIDSQSLKILKKGSQKRINLHILKGFK